MSHEEQPEEKKDYTGRIVVVLLCFVLLFAGFYYFKTATSPTEPTGIDDLPKVEYNHFEFIKYQEHWYTEWQRGENVYQIPLRFNPYEVEDVEIIGQLGDDFALEKELYITFHPVQKNLTFIALGAAELSQNVARALDIKPLAACMVNETEACHERPIITCANQNVSIALIRHADTPRIILNETCVILEGPEMDLLQAIDRFLYQWYGIMK